MLFGQNTFASSAFSSGVAPLAVTQEDITLNGFGLKNANFIVSNIDDTPAIDNDLFDLPKSNGRGLLGHYFRGRTITMQLKIKGNTQEEFESNLFEFRRQLKAQSTLTWKRFEETRQLIVEPISIPKSWNHYNISFLPNTITFSSNNPFWESINNVSNSYQNKISSFQEDITNEGNAPADLKIFLLFKSPISGLNNIKIIVGDNEIEINETISDNDTLIVDGTKKEVLLNGSEIDYNGTFPELSESVSNPINFTFNGSFELDINVLYKKQFK